MTGVVFVITWGVQCLLFTVHCTMNMVVPNIVPGHGTWWKWGSYSKLQSGKTTWLVVLHHFETRFQFPFGTEFVRAISSDISLTKLRSEKT